MLFTLSKVFTTSRIAMSYIGPRKTLFKTINVLSRPNRDNIITADSGGDFISGSGSSYDSETGGTFGSSVDDASTFSDYS